MGNYISSIRIKGFKKFKSFEASFNKDLNIIVGENESGKSTLLEALSVVLNQSIRNIDKSALENIFNKELIDEFESDPSIEKLPIMTIELFLNIDEGDAYAEDLYGDIYPNSAHKKQYGICFKCELERQIANELSQEIADKKSIHKRYPL